MKILFFSFSLCLSLFASDIDIELNSYINQFNLKPLEPVEGLNNKLFEVGEKLFNSKNISGFRNISCRDCHDPSKGTSDGLPLSLGQGRVTHGNDVFQGEGVLLKRNSPALFNLGYSDIKAMFWDARVRFNGEYFNTPEPALNGPNPEADYIAKNMKSALEMQVIFPMVSREEMLGAGSPLDSDSNLESWNKIILRFWNEDKVLMYSLSESLKVNPNDLNISHFAKALAHFISFEFNVTNTPYDQYLRGNKGALSQLEKEGMKLYLTKARCVICHGGKHLSNLMIQNIGIPKIHKEGEPIDYGLYEETGDQRHKFLFKNAGLRNISKSAPYMHNGSLKTLRDVIIHYNNIKLGLDEYVMPASYQIPYSDKVVQTSTDVLNQEIYSGVFQPFLRKGLNLSNKEIDALEYFLTKGLTELEK